MVSLALVSLAFPGVCIDGASIDATNDGLTLENRKRIKKISDGWNDFMGIGFLLA